MVVMLLGPSVPVVMLAEQLARADRLEVAGLVIGMAATAAAAGILIGTYLGRVLLDA